MTYPRLIDKADDFNAIPYGSNRTSKIVNRFLGLDFEGGFYVFERLSKTKTRFASKMKFVGLHVIRNFFITITAEIVSLCTLFFSRRNK